MRLLYFAYGLLTVLLPSPSFGQQKTNAAPEENIEREFHKLRSGYLTPDQVNMEDMHLEMMLTQYLRRPSTTKNLDNLPFHSTASDDGLLTIYSWDDELGHNGIRSYRKVFQFTSGKTNLIKSTPLTSNHDRDYSGLTQGIYSLQADPRIYVVISRSGSLNKYSEDVRFLSISGDVMTDSLKMIMAPDGLTDSMGITCDMDIHGNDDMVDKGMADITYDTKQKAIHIPVILENGAITKYYRIYKFNGQYFEKISSK